MDANPNGGLLFPNNMVYPNNCKLPLNDCVVPPNSEERFGYMKCPNMKNYGSDRGFDYYECKVCGERYTIDEEELK